MRKYGPITSTTSAGAVCTFAVRLALLATACLAPLPAIAGDRWEEAAGGAVAILPVPSKAKGITGGSFACAHQQWSFRLRADGSVPPGEASALVTIDKQKFATKSKTEASVITVPVPYETLDLLQSGTRLAFAIGEAKDGPSASFPLRFSKQVLEAVAPRCSQIDMTGYDRITLTETGSAVDEAKPLLMTEIELFREATSSEPIVSAARLDLPQGRGMLFASLCGSTRYYGRSGCTVSAFARPQPGVEWQEAYNSEGVILYIDPKASSAGWPNLVTLALVGGFEADHWEWTGAGYEPLDRNVANTLSIEYLGDNPQ